MQAVHFDRPLTPAQLRRAADLIANRPDVELHLYELHMMKGLTDSSPIAAPTALRRFRVTAMSQLARPKPSAASSAIRNAKSSGPARAGAR